METSSYELEWIGGPYAGKVTHCGSNDFKEGQAIEVTGPYEGEKIPSLYRYSNGALHWEGPILRELGGWTAIR